MKRIVGIFSPGLALVMLSTTMGVLVMPVFGAVSGVDLKNSETAVPSLTAPAAKGTLTPPTSTPGPGGSGTVNTLMVPKMADGAVVPSLEYSQWAQSAVTAAAAPVQYRTYGGFEFQPGTSELTFSTIGAGIYAVSIPFTGVSFRRALDLPNGAQITSISMFVIDNNASLNMTLQVSQNNPSVSVSQTFPISLSTTNTLTSPNVQTVSISGSPLLTIDTSQYNYALRYQPSVAGTGHQLVGVKIEFSLSTLGAYNTFDVDGNTQVDALTDGLILLRYMFGLRVPSLTAGTIGTGATRSPGQIEAYIQSVMP